MVCAIDCMSPAMSGIYDNVLELIGNTPVIRSSRLDSGPCELFIKLESQNPGGSIKDRIGLNMIEAAERAGKIKPGAALVEGTAGNTGLALALVAQQKGYRLILVIPDKMSREKISNLKATGAEVIITRSDVSKGHPQYYQDYAQRIADETPGSYFINQFGNDDNPDAHEHGTGPEIWAQMDEQLDAIVLGVGSSGTVTGLSRYFAKVAPDLELILADPEGSILTEYVNDGKLNGKSKSWLVEGIGEDFLPVISDFSRVSKAYSISDRESFLTGRDLLRTEGILGGASTGTLIAAALRYCHEQTEPKRVLTFACDTGNKYLSKMYNDQWMRDLGFLDTEQHGNLRDVIARPLDQGETIIVRPDEPIANAYKRMKTYDISQLPVLAEDGELQGIIDESDILLAVIDCPECFDEPVSTAMVSDLHTVDVNTPVRELMPVFDAGYVVMVEENDRFIGLITRLDLLNHLRRSSGLD